MSQPKLVLYQYPGLSRNATLSPPCGKVQMALRFKGLDFEIHNLRTPGEVRKVNLRGRVPALKIGDELVADSTDVLHALEARFPEPPLDPADPQLRLEALLWEDWADECLYFYGVYLRWMTEAAFEEMRRKVFARQPWPLRAIIPGIAKRLVRRRLKGQGTGDKPPEVIWREFRDALDRVNARLEGRDYLVGDALSRADLAVVSIVDQLTSDVLPPGLQDELETRPHLRAWCDRIHAVVPTVAG